MLALCSTAFGRYFVGIISMPAYHLVPPTQYGGYDTRFVIEWVRARILSQSMDVSSGLIAAKVKTFQLVRCQKTDCCQSGKMKKVTKKLLPDLQV
ncbi:hypothetical protein TNCV_1631131 [Trichonephila clavipes]|nr:hypothetical protein TNCV_1631131 [Trichonephila clavipes]